MQLTIDARMLYHSGIGTTLRNILVRIPELSERDTVYAGNEKAQTFLTALFKKSRVQLNKTAIYSIAEQVYPLLHPATESLFWSPHYNFPLAHRGPLVVTIHDTLHLAHPQLFGGPHKQFYARYMLANAARKAVALICVSDFTRKELCRLVKVDGTKVHVIHNGVDESWFQIPEAASPHPRPFLLFVGNVKPHKNLGRLMTAFASLSAEIPHDLIIVGQKEGMRSGDDAVLQEAKKLGDRITFTGLIDDATLKQYFKHTSLFVFPSYYEGFGLPPLEAMAAGAPTIVARASALPEVCGDHASYFDPFDENDLVRVIKEALNTEAAIQEEKILKAREYARSFSWEITAKKTWQVLTQATHGDAEK